MELKKGIYDQLITGKVRQLLTAAEFRPLEAEIADLEESDYPTYLSRHFARQIKVALGSLPVANRKAKQIELVNGLLATLAVQNEEESERVEDPGKILQAIYSPPKPPLRPAFPLTSSGLIINARDEPRLGGELEKELRTADRVLMLVSFIQWRGLQRLKAAFEDLARAGTPVRVLTTTYMGASDLEALRALVAFENVELKISMDGRRRRLHAKAWLFERSNGFSTAYVGSANVSGPALEDGIEWTVKLSEVETPHVLLKFQGAFESLWAEEEFELFPRGDEGFEARVSRALDAARGGTLSTSMPIKFFDLRPHPYQQATLDQLEAERLDRGFWRNLVVAPTGTGKTILAAFDYKRQIPSTGVRPRLLFLAHRRELLEQGRDTFRHVLRDENFGQILADGREVDSYEFLFSTVHSFRTKNLIHSLTSDYWDFVVIDEAHHVTAESYLDAVSKLKPRILLGLTATPERMDGQSILPWFDNRIADEMRLWHAIERQYLVPFDYYGIHDGTDLTGITWSRGSYSKADLEIYYVHNVRRAELVISEFRAIYGNCHQARCLGFCVSIAHAVFMARMFTDAGIPSEALTGETPDDVRTGSTQRLRRREINVLFTVDLFNEGVDIPEVDCLLFLRPTESATIFIQQFGRGLRLDTGKQNCLVLDFIGNQRREFRFDMRLQVLLGGTRKNVIQQLEDGITSLPGNCYFRLDRESQKQILANLRERLTANQSRLVQELRVLALELGRTPTLREFLHETQYELHDVYKTNRSWTSLLQEAQLLDALPSAEDLLVSSRFRNILHIDSIRRLKFYRDAVASGLGPEQRENLLNNRMALMLSRSLFREQTVETRDSLTGVNHIQESPILKSEFFELVECLEDSIPEHVEESPYVPGLPLFMHRRYTRDEILVATGYQTLDNVRSSREGLLRLPDQTRELLFVTLDKSEKHFSPTTRYEDFAVSRTRFHWQSQSTTGENTQTGLRYRNQRENGWDFVLFVREKRGNPYVFLGPLRFVSYQGGRPMSIYWDLITPMPAWFFEICASLKAA